MKYSTNSIITRRLLLFSACLAAGISLLITPPLFGFRYEDKAGEQNKAAHESASPAAVSQDFIIGAGDVINVFVWKEPDFSKTVPVRPDGKISLPLVNDIQAAGLSAIQLKESITKSLSQFVTEPAVTVTVEAVNSQKVVVMGEVNSAGPRPLAGPTRVMDIIASAGFTPFAKTSKIYILRNEGEHQQRFDFNYKEFIKGKRPEQNILLKNGDTIIVP